MSSWTNFRIECGRRLAVRNRSLPKTVIPFAALIVALIVSGCNQLWKRIEEMGKAEPAAPAPTAAPSAAPTAVTTQAKATAAPSTKAPAAASTGGLPPLVRDDLPLEKISESKAADKAGDVAAKAGDLEGAEKEYRRALSIDPGNLAARYSLARTFLKKGDAETAIAALEPLNVPGCLLCAERLLTATQDKRFEKIHQNPTFLALTKDAHKSLLKMDIGVEHMIAWFMKTPHPTLQGDDYIDPRALIVIEDKTVGAKSRFVQLHGSQDFRRHVKAAYPKGIYPGGRHTCENGCCDFAGSIPAVHLKRMCFKMSGAAPVHLYKIAIEGDPANSFPG